MFNGISHSQQIDNQNGLMFSFGKICDTLIQPKASVKKFKCSLKEERESREKLAIKLTHLSTQEGITSPKMKEEESPYTGKFYSEPSIKDNKENKRPNWNDICPIDSAIRNVHLGKKTKRTSEEIVLEKIKKEKELLKQQKLANATCYKKSKKYVPLSIIPSPLTLIKPFRLSSSSSTTYLKKRMTRSETDIELVNNKIKSKLRSKSKLYESK